jgi:hypothetical protein
METVVRLLLIQYTTRSGTTTVGAARLQLLVFIVGAFLVVWGSFPLVRARRWHIHASRTTGCVVDHVRSGGRKHMVAAPIVEFDVGEAHVRFVGVDDGRSPRPLGSTVPVLYDPADPRRARLGDLKMIPSWWLIVGLVAVVVALAAT